MGSFGEVAFEPGAVRVVAGPSGVRHVRQADVRGGGEQVTVQGREARQLAQHGAWLGDDPAELRAKAQELAGAMDGQLRTLIDDSGTAWPGVVLVRIDEGELQRVGVRWRLTFTAHYLQPTWGEPTDG